MHSPRRALGYYMAAGHVCLDCYRDTVAKRRAHGPWRTPIFDNEERRECAICADVFTGPLTIDDFDHDVLWDDETDPDITIAWEMADLEDES